MKKKTVYLSVFIFFVAVFVIRLFVGGLISGFVQIDSNSSFFYNSALDINHGKFFYYESEPTAEKSVYPVFSYLAAFFLKNTANALSVIKFSQFAVSLFICAVIYFIGAKTANIFVGVCGALMFALEPLGLYHSLQVTPDVLTGFLSLLSILAAFLFQREYKMFYGVMFGVILSMAVCLKPVLFFFPVFYGLLYMSLYFKNSYINCFRLIFIPVITIILFLCPWVINNYKISDGHNLIPANGYIQVELRSQAQPESDVYKKTIYEDNNGCVFACFLKDIIKSPFTMYDLFKPELTVFKKSRFIIYYTSIFWYLTVVFGLIGIILSRKTKIFMPLHGFMVFSVFAVIFNQGEILPKTAFIAVFIVYACAGVSVILPKVFKSLKIQINITDNQWRYKW